jgi:CO/xanthine dehydrogenase Mo-binding subunit
MEPFTCYANFDRYGRLHVISSTQIVFHTRRILSRALGIPKSQIRVEKPRIGGGFGASEYVKGLSGVMLCPAVGVKIGMFKAQLGYNVQKISESGVSINFSALQLKAGVVF